VIITIRRGDIAVTEPEGHSLQTRFRSAKDRHLGNKTINARPETLAEEPSFKRLPGNGPCLVLAGPYFIECR
jgi:putative SOS response-associated peptidase YedK